MRYIFNHSAYCGRGLKRYIKRDFGDFLYQLCFCRRGDWWLFKVAMFFNCSQLIKGTKAQELRPKIFIHEVHPDDIDK